MSQPTITEPAPGDREAQEDALVEALTAIVRTLASEPPAVVQSAQHAPKKAA